MCFIQEMNPGYGLESDKKSIMKQTLMNFKSIACFKGPVQRKQRDSRMDFLSLIHI